MNKILKYINFFVKQRVYLYSNKNKGLNMNLR